MLGSVEEFAKPDYGVDVFKLESPVNAADADGSSEVQAVFDDFMSLECSAEWEKLSEKDRGDIYAYLWGHAYDSPSPAKCK